MIDKGMVPSSSNISETLEYWIGRLKTGDEKVLADLEAWAEWRENPEVRKEFLRRLGTHASKSVLERVIQARPSWIIQDASTFDYLVRHRPRVIRVFLKFHTLPLQRVFYILKLPQGKSTENLLNVALKKLQPALVPLVRDTDANVRTRIAAWADVFEQLVSNPRLVKILWEWLEGKPRPSQRAFRILRPIITGFSKEDPRVKMLPVFIQRQLLSGCREPLPRRETAWVLTQIRARLPRRWISWIKEYLTTTADLHLYWLSTEVPSLRPYARNLITTHKEHFPNWIRLEVFLDMPRFNSGHEEVLKLQALLMELGVGIRKTRRKRMAATGELQGILENLPPRKFYRRLRQFLTQKEIPGGEAFIGRLVQRKLIRRTVIPKVYECLVPVPRLRQLTEKIQTDEAEKRANRRAKLQELIKQNLIPLEGSEFVPDPFQTRAVDAFIHGRDVLVTAPTGSGKTWIAAQAMREVLSRKGRAFYSTPLRALSYQKLRAFREIFGNDHVGVLTGEYRELTNAPLLVGTTEIVRNLLLDNIHFDLLVMDEAHYLGDIERGSAWEEAILMTPHDTRLILLSATIPNDREIQEWLQSLGRNVEIATRTSRPVPLVYLTWIEDQPELGLHMHGYHPSLKELLERLQKMNMTPALVFVGRRDDALVLATEAMRIMSRKEHLSSHLPSHPLSRLLLHGVGAHHAGLSYDFRAAVETLLEKGELEVVFCTSSLAHGIDAPVRTTVLYDVSPFWERSHLQHALGRAGRRGFDRVGFATVALPPWNIRRIIRALRQGSEPLRSAFAPHDAAVAGLIHQYGIEGAIRLAQQSLRAAQGDRHVVEHIVQSFQRLVQLGFIGRDGRLTEQGSILVKLMHPNAVAIVKVLQTVSRISVETATAIAAFFCNERPPKKIRTKASSLLINQMTRISNEIMLPELDPQDGARRVWMTLQMLHGHEDELRAMVGVDSEGDIERMRIQVIELLRKMETLNLTSATEALYYLDPHFHQDHPNWGASTEISP